MNTYQGGTGMFWQAYNYKQVRWKYQLNISLKYNSKPGNLQDHVDETHGQPLYVDRCKNLIRYKVKIKQSWEPEKSPQKHHHMRILGGTFVKHSYSSSVVTANNPCPVLPSRSPTVSCKCYTYCLLVTNV